MTDSLGARLRQARELRRLSLQQASEITKLRIHYLQALENDDYSAIPSGAQARGFLRVYAEFLELDLANLIPPPQPAPAASPAPAAPAAPSLASSISGILTSLLGRLGRRTAKEAALPPAAADSEVPVMAASPVMPVPEPLPTVEAVVEPVAAPAPVAETAVVAPANLSQDPESLPAPDATAQPAAADVKTKTARRPKTASDGVKKNAAN